MNGQLIQNIIGGIVVASALLFAGVLLFSNALEYLFGWKRIVMIGVLILYALYRFSRIYQVVKRQKMQQNEDN
jgi:membrane protein DedA with SNARE-associated domain